MSSTTYIVNLLQLLNFTFKYNILFMYISQLRTCHSSCDLTVLRVDVQREGIQKLDSELQILVNKSRKLEDDWVSLCCAGMSEDAINEKLEQVRTTAQTNTFLQQIHDANKNVESKRVEMNVVKQDLESVALRVNEAGTALRKLIADKNKNTEQVHGKPHVPTDYFRHT